MRAPSFSRFFIARAVALQLLILGLWWFVLYQPSLALLRVIAEIPFTLLTARQDRDPIEVDASGEWKFSVPVSAYVRDSAEGKGPVSVNAIEFSAPAANVAPFATGWFVYLGLALSVPISRSNLRRILLGLAIQTIVSGVALLGYAEINARGVVANMYKTPDATVLWLEKLAYHIDYLVVPYASPFLVAIATLPDWWTFLTSGARGQVAVPTSPTRKPKKARAR